MRGSQTIKRWWQAGSQAFDALVFPWECPLCGASAMHAPFCDLCRRALLDASTAPACGRCAMPLGPWASQSEGCSECRGRPLGFDAAVALGSYDGAIRDLCLRLKQERSAWLAPWLADVLVEARPALEQVSRDALIVPIPLHWRRHWERGYNQADALGRGLARRLRLPLAHPLRRVRATPKLARAGRLARAELMHHAFQARRGINLTGRTVLLVDDILTTGATSSAAARALKRAGAAHVLTVVVARAEGTPLR